MLGFGTIVFPLLLLLFPLSPPLLLLELQLFREDSPLVLFSFWKIAGVLRISCPTRKSKTDFEAVHTVALFSSRKTRDEIFDTKINILDNQSNIPRVYIFIVFLSKS